MRSCRTGPSIVWFELNWHNCFCRQKSKLWQLNAVKFLQMSAHDAAEEIPAYVTSPAYKPSFPNIAVNPTKVKQNSWILNMCIFTNLVFNWMSKIFIVYYDIFFLGLRIWKSAWVIYYLPNCYESNSAYSFLESLFHGTKETTKKAFCSGEQSQYRYLWKRFR